MKVLQKGDKFGFLTVEYEVPKAERPNQNGRYYFCQCDCGNTKVVYGHNLKTGNTRSCGCLSKKTSSEGNSTKIPEGTRYGMLVVIGRAEVRPGGLAYWKCRCDCGNETEVAGRDLRSGHTTSCGCKKLANIINEVNNRYGKLLVIAYDGSRENGGAKWRCKCDCGNEIIVDGYSLRSGHTKSCGCIKSWAEEKISNLFSNHKINYTTQYTFSDLRTDIGGTPRFDFAIFLNNKLYCLIEYHGEQHYNTESTWYSQEYQDRDKLKEKYCLDNNIPLLIWNKETNIEEEIISLRQILRVEENKNDFRNI